MAHGSGHRRCDLDVTGRDRVSREGDQSRAADLRAAGVGRKGEHFGMLKFRSTVPHAHERLAEVLAAEGVERKSALSMSRRTILVPPRWAICWTSRLVNTGRRRSTAYPRRTFDQLVRLAIDTLEFDPMSRTPR